MLDFKSAQEKLVANAKPIQLPEKIPLGHAPGRVLAKDIQASIDAPSADNSAMDGYAIRLKDIISPINLPIQERCYAGMSPRPLQAGFATRIFTSALIPLGADAVVMQEDCKESRGVVEILRAPEKYQHIRRRGEEILAGDVLLQAGVVLGPAHIALLASQGISSIDCTQCLKVGILTNGDELVDAGAERALHQIFDANGPMLEALLRNMNAVISKSVRAADTEAGIRSVLVDLLSDSDLIISIGGVSVGDKDFIKPALESLGGSLSVCRVNMKPGKPVACADINGKIVICLPGNPAAAFSVFTTLVTPLIRKLQGRTALFPILRKEKIRLEKSRTKDKDEFLQVRCKQLPGSGIELIPSHSQSSNFLSSLPLSDGLARLPAGTAIHDGSLVEYYDFLSWLA